MSWNHRVVRREYPDAAPSERIAYGIHEVYYDAEGKPDRVTQSAINAWGGTVDELRDNLRQMLRALDQPILNYKDIAHE